MVVLDVSAVDADLRSEPDAVLSVADDDAIAILRTLHSRKAGIPLPSEMPLNADEFVKEKSDMDEEDDFSVDVDVTKSFAFDESHVACFAQSVDSPRPLSDSEFPSLLGPVESRSRTSVDEETSHQSHQETGTHHRNVPVASRVAKCL